MTCELRTLRVRNLVIIEDLTVEFSTGLNLLTGETGAGKSILVDALGLVTGERADRSLVRSGASRAIVEGLFHVPVGSAAAGWLREQGFEMDTADGELLIRREVPAAGSGRVSLNGSPATVGMLRELGKRLIALHGQFEQQSLLTSEYQLALLDSFGGHARRGERVALAFDAELAATEHLEELRREAGLAHEQRDRLERDAREIESVGPLPDELTQLDRECAILRGGAQMAELLGEVVALAHDGEPSAAELASAVAARAERLAEIDVGLLELAARARSAAVELEDVGAALRDYRDRADFDPKRLDELESRRAALRELTLRHATDEAGLIELAASHRKQLDTLDSLDQVLGAAEQDRRAAAERYQADAAALSQARQAAGRDLARRLAPQLAALALGKSVFEAGLPPAEPPSRRGAERVELRVALNPGEPVRPLAQAASGGELSRIMLALHTVAGAEAGGRVVVFDEVDTGVGGAVADAVGARLAELGRHQQVLCVTHLPQVAAYADLHFQVRKQVRDGRTHTAIVGLTAEHRVEELARMLGGRKPTDTSRRHAEELLQAAGHVGPSAGRKA